MVQYTKQLDTAFAALADPTRRGILEHLGRGDTSISELAASFEMTLTPLEFRLGNRSALEWVIDQYRVTRDDEGDIVSDPNRDDDEDYIVRLIGKVITVSVETVKVCQSLPKLD